MNGSSKDRSWGRFDWLKTTLGWIGVRLDVLAALLAGAAAAVSGAFGDASSHALTTATLGVLTVVALSLVLERSLRLKANERMQDVLNEAKSTHDAVQILNSGVPYHVVESDSAWDIAEDGSARSVRRRLLRFAQDDAISVVDWITADGQIQDTKYTPGKAVHEFVSDGRKLTLVALDRPHARDEEREFTVERSVRGAFLKNPDRGWVIALDPTSLMRITIRWPRERPPKAVRFLRRTDTDRGKPVIVAAAIGKDGRSEFTAEVREPARGERIGVEWDWDPPPAPAVPTAAPISYVSAPDGLLARLLWRRRV